MKERKNALLLSGICFLAVFLILFIVHCTEKDAGNFGTAYNFAWASFICALISFVLITWWIALNEAERRPWASGWVTNPKYSALKRKTAESLRWVYLDPKKQADSDERIRNDFFLFGINYGVTYNQLEADYKAICEAIERVTK